MPELYSPKSLQLDSSKLEQERRRGGRGEGRYGRGRRPRGDILRLIGIGTVGILGIGGLVAGYNKFVRGSDSAEAVAGGLCDTSDIAAGIIANSPCFLSVKSPLDLPAKDDASRAVESPFTYILSTEANEKTVNGKIGLVVAVEGIDVDEAGYESARSINGMAANQISPLTLFNYFNAISKDANQTADIRNKSYAYCESELTALETAVRSNAEKFKNDYFPEEIVFTYQDGLLSCDKPA